MTSLVDCECSVRVVALMADVVVFYLLTAKTAHMRRNDFEAHLRSFAAFYCSVTACLVAEIVVGVSIVVRTCRTLSVSDYVFKIYLNIFGML